MDLVHLFQDVGTSWYIIFTTSLSTEKETGLDRPLECEPILKAGPYIPHPEHPSLSRVAGTTFWAV